MKMNHWIRTFVFSLALLGRGLVGAFSSSERKKGKRRGRKTLILAESFESVTQVHTKDYARYQAGDYYVWNNKVWDFDKDENIPTTVIGTSRGSCVLLEDGNSPPGHCSWTLTITEQHHDDDEDDDDEDDDKQDDDHEEKEVSKLMVMGDVDSLAWEHRQTLAIVGGTGEYEGAAGEIDVISESGFFLYEIYLD